jgi:hypothetical protein
LISPNGISIRLRLRGYTELGSNFWFACPIPSSVVSAIYGALEWLITVVINFLYIPDIMESPPYDTPTAQHTMIPSFHQFNLIAFLMQVVWVLCKIILLKIVNGHAMNLPGNCEIMQFKGFAWPWTSGSEESSLSE